jgi:UDP-GlcNAc:undecaprenyl-phosphate/decaprenyl-phosphate GlcNAc-1-phosphate transferase
MIAILSSAIALLVASLALMMLRRSRRLPLNLPNERSLHLRAVPRGGGLAVWTGWLVATVWVDQPQPWLLPLIALILVSLCDDRYGVPVAWRLLAQVGCAAIWAWAAAPTASAAGIVLIAVCAANFYNFMDGSDGLAALMALVGFGAYAAAAWFAQTSPTVFAAALVAAVVPFFFLNFPPASMFLGDVGSVPLGFLAAAFGVAGVASDLWPFWFPVLVFLPFVADAGVTLARRAVRGERIWQAHREHYYQRLVRMGFGHLGVLALYGALMVGSALSALAALVRSPASGVTVLCLWGGIHALLFAAIDYAWRRSDDWIDESKC